MKTLIIGGDAAGMSVASKLRRADPAAQVTVLSARWRPPTALADCRITLAA